MQFLLAVDLETTGLEPDFHEITQIGVKLLDHQLDIKGTFQSLVRIKHPERGITPEFNVFEYTNIDPAKLEQAPDLETVLSKLIKFIVQKTGLEKEELGEVTLFGQNPRFDYDFLLSAFTIVGRKWPFDYHSVDNATLFLVYHLLKFGGFPESLSQKKITTHFGIDTGLAEHNALNDITVTTALFRHTLEHLSIKEEKE